jgi:hypothetical protein
LTHRKHLKKSAKYLLPILALIFIFIYRYSCTSLLYEHFVSQRIELPKKGSEFVIRPVDHTFPAVMINIIKLSFPEYQITVSKAKKPHLIIIDVTSKRSPILEELNTRAPYIIYSGESKALKQKKYRANGHPTAQFIPFYKPPKENHLFLPFIAWGKPNLFNTNRRIPPTKEALMKKRISSM